ncbi:YggT family protein [Nocardia sp. NPDC052566]|uniref:YggT family protein n=1 Tax=Nocardia sp. NPDC052566 TaxID=3364330 RepID=UPI0037C4F5F9
MGIIGAVIGLALTAFMLLLLARVILDWIGVLSTGTPPPWVSKSREVTQALTEPVIAPVRKVLKPIRVGGLSIDLAFTVVFIAVIVLRSIAFSL